MKNPLKHIFPIRFLSGLAVGISLLISLPKAQALPTGMTTVPFYDTNQVGLSFKKDRLSTMGMYEVPGKPQFFVVLGYFGYLWTLYPDLTKGDTIIANINIPGTSTPHPVKHYVRTQVADFNSVTMKGWEQGALGGSFDPNFSVNHYFYVIYNKYASSASYHTGVAPTSVDGPNNAGLVCVDRYVMSTNYASMIRDTAIICMPHGTGYGSSNLVFGKDGYMYITADAYNQNSWDSTNYMRKILRIDVAHQDPGKMYAVPPTNPWIAAAAANPSRNYIKEVYAYGFRNTYSLQADYVTGDIWGAEVGQSTWEEVNKILPGHNYGWANGGDNSTVGANSFGVEGPCSNNTTTGQGYGATSITSTGTATFHTMASTYNGHTFTCADVTNGIWNFAHSGATVNGIATSLPGTQISCMTMSQAYRGDPSSPYYGYKFVTDTQRAYFLAVKDSGVAPINVGGMASSIPINQSGCPSQHDGPVAFSEDSYGNLYVISVCSSSSGAEGWHDIYQLYSPTGMIPLTTPRAQVLPAGTTALWGTYHTANKAMKLVTGFMPGSIMEIPKGYSGVELYNLTGRKVWSYRGSDASVRIPGSIGHGLLQARFVP